MLQMCHLFAFAEFEEKHLAQKFESIINNMRNSLPDRWLSWRICLKRPETSSILFVLYGSWGADAYNPISHTRKKNLMSEKGRPTEWFFHRPIKGCYEARTRGLLSPGQLQIQLYVSTVRPGCTGRPSSSWLSMAATRTDKFVVSLVTRVRSWRYSSTVSKEVGWRLLEEPSNGIWGSGEVCRSTTRMLLDGRWRVFAIRDKGIASWVEGGVILNANEMYEAENPPSPLKATWRPPSFVYLHEMQLWSQN